MGIPTNLTRNLLWYKIIVILMSRIATVECSPHGRLGAYDVDEVRATLIPYIRAADLQYFLRVEDPFNPPVLPIDPLLSNLIPPTLESWGTKKVLDFQLGAASARSIVLQIGSMDVAEVLTIGDTDPHIRPFGQDRTGHHPAKVITEIFGGVNNQALLRRQELCEAEGISLNSIRV